ncbi:hypothetical protein LCGC14_2144010, partial [marine sediment metagenome]
LLRHVDVTIETNNPNRVSVVLEKGSVEPGSILFTPALPLLIKSDVQEAIVATLKAISEMDLPVVSTVKVKRIIRKVMKTCMAN